MGASLSPTTIVNVAKLSAVYSYAEACSQRAYGGGSVDDRLSVLLNMEADILDWRNVNFPSDPSLPVAADYVLALCGRFINKALATLGQGGGGVIVNPVTGQPVAVVGRVFQFTIGDSTTNPPLSDGGISYAINEPVVVDTFQLSTINGGPMPRNDPNQFSYTIQYSVTGAVITFNQPVQNGMQFVESYLAGATSLSTTGSGGSGGGGGTSLPVQAGHRGQVLFTDSQNLYWSDTTILVMSADFEADGKTVIMPELANNSYFLAWADIPTYLFSDNDDFTPITTGGFVINLPNFDSRVANVHIIVHVKGINS